MYSVISLLLLMTDKEFIFDVISKINKKIIFPILLLINIVFIVLEKNYYDNFVLTHFYVFPYSFLYILLVSGLMLCISIFKEKNKIERIIKVAFPIILIIFYYMWIEYHHVFINLTKEDSVVECAQFFLFLISGYVALKIFFKIKKNKKLHSTLFLLLSISLFFVAFEEISWGQRIFNLETPKTLQELNVQKETNIHNIFGYNVNQIIYVLIGLYGMFSRKIIIRFFPKKAKQLLIFTPQKYFFWYFFIVFFVYLDRSFFNLNYDTVINGVFRKYAIWQWLEISELYLAIVFLAYLLITLKEAKK
jgi:hypothetical protein